MRRGLAALTVAILPCVLSGMLLAQVRPTLPQAPAGTAAVRGRVVDADTGAPIPAATVTAIVILAAGSGFAPPPPARAVTDANGVFEIRELRAGLLQLSAAAQDYVTEVYRPTIPSRGPTLTAGRVLTDITIPLSRGGVITGVVR